MQAARPLRVTTSPHVKDNATTQRIMLDVIVALIPAGAFGVWYFGWNALWLILTSVISAVCWEALIQKLLKRPVTVRDLSAVVTGLLLAYNLPASVPLWLAVVGTGIAIVLVKQLFGGLGHNFINPALTARAVLLTSWMGLMTSTAFVRPGLDAISNATPLADAVSGATPMADAVSSATAQAAASAGGYGLWELFIGTVPGCIGEVSKLCLIVGGLYLIVRGVVNWRIPLTILVACFAMFWAHSGSLAEGVNAPAYQLLSGGLILGAFFMATDYSTSPISNTGRVVFGVGIAALVFVIRAFNDTYPEGVSYAILIMNCATPLIDKFTRPRIYGEAKRHA